MFHIHQPSYYIFVVKSLIRFLLHISTPFVELVLTIDKIYQNLSTFSNGMEWRLFCMKKNVASRLNGYRMATKSFKLFILRLSHFHSVS